MNDRDEFDERHRLEKRPADGEEGVLRRLIRVQLRLKFGEVDPQLLARIEDLPAELLDEALTRSFSADSVEALLEETRFRTLDYIDQIIQDRYTNKGHFDGRSSAYRLGYIEGFREEYVKAALPSLRLVLRSLMHQKFGDIDPQLLARIDTLPAESIDKAFRRVLTADSVEAVLGDERSAS